jgi:hypothetical protein
MRFFMDKCDELLEAIEEALQQEKLTLDKEHAAICKELQRDFDQFDKYYVKPRAQYE